MYSNSKLVNYTKISPNRTLSRNDIVTVAIHCMAGHLSVEQCANVFSSPSRAASSNYGIDDEGKVGLYVEEKHRAWTTSSRAVDMHAVTIEVASDSKAPYAVTDKAYEKLILLVTDICKRNNIKRLHWSDNKAIRKANVEHGYIQVHCDYANKACPGQFLLSRMDDIVKEVNKNLGAFDTKVPHNEYSHSDFVKDIKESLHVTDDKDLLQKTITISAKTNRKHKCVKYIQKYLKEKGYSEIGNADGIAGPKFTMAIKHYQANNGCKSDGIISARNKTWKKLLKL